MSDETARVLLLLLVMGALMAAGMAGMWAVFFAPLVRDQDARHRALRERSARLKGEQ